MPQSANQPPPSMVADSGKVAPRRNGPVIEKIGVPGERVDIRQHMEQDMTVVFDFYADWCGPCRQLTPKLEALARKYPDKIAVKKIDIVRWNTPVAQQFGISSIPYLEVYDASGKKIRNGNGFTVLQYVEKMASGW
ncbi:MAG: thioredoxin family protein [Acidobacteria bacterium]|nr:thioredoxin family protein [Acidobacteriota bacterium]